MPTLRSFLTGTYVRKRPGLSPASVAQYRYACHSLEIFAGHKVKLAELTEDLFLRWMAWRLRQRAPRTVRRERGDILTLWRAAAAAGKCRAPPAIPSVAVPRTLPVAFWPDELEALIAECRRLKGVIRGTEIPKSAWWVSLVYFLCDSLARISAALAVRPSQVDLRHRIALLAAGTSKTGIEQIVRLHDRTVAAIAGIWQPQAERVWPWPYNRRQLWETLGRILKRAGLPADRYHKFHCFRRTSATCTAAQQGPAAAQQLLGHTTPGLLHRYLDPRLLPPVQAADPFSH